MFTKMSLRREKKKVEKALNKDIEKLCVKYTLLLKSKKRYEKDDSVYSKDKLVIIDARMKKTLKGIIEKKDKIKQLTV